MIPGEIYKIDYDKLLNLYKEERWDLELTGINLIIINENGNHQEIYNLEVEDGIKQTFLCLKKISYINPQNTPFGESYGGYICLWKLKQIYCGPGWEKILVKIS